MAKKYQPVVSILKWQLLVAFVLCSVSAWAQQAPTVDTIGSAALSKSFSAQNELFLSKLKDEAEDRKLSKYYQSNFREVFKALNEGIMEGEVVNIPAVSSTLERILSELKAKNPAVPADLRFFVLRNNLPNAFTIGDNSLFVNLGLFYYLENEDQVASVISHEIGHLLLTHTLKAMKYGYEKDKENAEDARELLHTQVKRSDRAFDLVRNSIYNVGKMKREHEMQADSLGYELFKNTGYQKNAFISALDIITRYDTLRPDGLTVESHKRFFDLPNQKFDDKWLKQEDFSSYTYGKFTEKFDKDSTSSHPKSKERIQYLVSIFPELKQPGGTSATTGSFKAINTIAQNEQMPILFFKEEYGEAVYDALLHLQERPGDTVYRNWLGKAFQKIYEGRRDYQLNKYLDRISPKDQTASYIQFLSFMWNLKLEEIKNIADYYAQKN